MNTIKLAAGLALAFALAAPAFADTTVKVELWDRGGMMDMSARMGMGLHANMHMAMMGVSVDKTTVPAGNVTFDVTNISKDTVHEMLVAPIESTDVVLPYNAEENRVDEETSGDLGEVSELDPGKGGALMLDLKPGLYILYCNIPGHFMAGMWTTIEVK